MSPTATPSRLPPRLKRTKSNQSLKSTCTTTSNGSSGGGGGGRPSIEYSAYPQQQKPNTAPPATNAGGGGAGNNIGISKLRQPSPATSHAKLLARSESNASLNAAYIPLSTSPAKKKSLPKLNQSSSSGADDDKKPCMTRTSSNGSSSTVGHSSSIKRRSSSNLEKRKSKQQMAASGGNDPGEDFVVDMLRDELEKEKASARALQGQKEGTSYCLFETIQGH